MLISERRAGGTLSSRHLTVAAPTELPLAQAAAAMFRELADRLLEQRITPLQEKVYGPLAGRGEVLRIRRKVLGEVGLDPDLPCTYTAGRRDEDLGLGGVQLWGVTGQGSARVRTVTASNGVTGRLCEVPGIRLLHLFSVRGTGRGEAMPRGVAEQAERMFENAEAALTEHGFAFEHVVRTWIYLARLLDWYGEFNRVRAAFLGARGITGRPGGRPYPASTGIQGTSGDEECVMDLLAVAGQSDVVTTRPIDGSHRQQQPRSYGSSFSRGMWLRCGGEETVFVSGTASIDAAGQTLHCWRREAQILETLLGVAALLEDQGASLADIAQATLFCKDRKTLEVYRHVTRQLGIEPMPVIPVLADVCRPELMVEMEALALVPRGAARGSRLGEVAP